MIDRKQWVGTAVRGLGVLAGLALLLTAWFGAATSVSAEGYSGTGITAETCDAAGSCWYEIGARFTVTTEDGEFLGSCTISAGKSYADPVQACYVFTPGEMTVVVTEDVGTITPGYAPEQNPIYDHTVTRQSAAPVSVNVFFRNVPQGDHSALVDQIVQTLIRILEEILAGSRA